MSKRDKAIDKALNDYATEMASGSDACHWWWNGNDVIADALASLIHHLRKDGNTYYTKAEAKELKTMERYMRTLPETSGILINDQERWLHAEAMHLLGKWFMRLWD